VKSMAANVRDFRALGLSAEALDKILDSNSRKVFG
jgi:hypothetical protein